MKFLISKEYGQPVAKAHFLQPARQSIVEDWVGYIRAEFPEKAKDVNIAAFADGHINGYSVVTETFANMVGASEIAKRSGMQSIPWAKRPFQRWLPFVREQIEALQKPGEPAAE
jgi:hypothetical protein